MAKEPAQLLERNFGLAEQRRNIWLATASGVITEADVLEHSFWAHVARHLQPCDEIIVMHESNEWRLHLAVLSVDKVGASVGVIIANNWREVAKDALDVSDAFSVRWRGPYDRFGVVRKDTGEVIKAGFQTKEAALDFLRETSMAA